MVKQPPHLRQIASARFDKKRAWATASGDRGSVTIHNGKFAARQIILVEFSDAIEKARPGVVVEILRRQSFPRLRQAVDDILQELIACEVEDGDGTHHATS